MSNNKVNIYLDSWAAAEAINVFNQTESYPGKNQWLFGMVMVVCKGRLYQVTL